MQILLGTVIDAGDAARGENEGHRFVQTVVVIVDGKEARHVVIVDKGDEIFFPGKVAGFLREDGINLGEICVGTEDAADSGVSGKSSIDMPLLFANLYES